VVEAGELPADLDVPTLRQAYVPPPFRVTEAVPHAPAAEERFWNQIAARSDLHPFLAGYLTSPRARQAPIVVLGQPGAGKSVLTRVLAAELPEGGFLPIRVRYAVWTPRLTCSARSNRRCRLRPRRR
jgi:hypothetical protein